MQLYTKLCFISKRLIGSYIKPIRIPTYKLCKKDEDFSSSFIYSATMSLSSFITRIILHPPISDSSKSFTLHAIPVPNNK